MKRWARLFSFLGKSSLLVAFILTMFNLFPAAPRAWAQLSTASINGTVRDSTGAVVPGATLTLTNTGTNVAQTAVTKRHGRLRDPEYPAGAVHSQGW
jgi:hypothetical protein